METKEMPSIIKWLKTTELEIFFSRCQVTIREVYTMQSHFCKGKEIYMFTYDYMNMKTVMEHTHR